MLGRLSIEHYLIQSTVLRKEGPQLVFGAFGSGIVDEQSVAVLILSGAFELSKLGVGVVLQYQTLHVSCGRSKGDTENGGMLNSSYQRIKHRPVQKILMHFNGRKAGTKERFQKKPWLFIEDI